METTTNAFHLHSFSSFFIFNDCLFLEDIIVKQMDNLPSLAGATGTGQSQIQCKNMKKKTLRLIYAGINTFISKSNPIRKILEAKQANHLTA